MPDETKNPWTFVSTKKVYENNWISVREDAVVRPDGERGIYGVVHFKNIAIGVLAVEDDFIYLVGQYRYALDKYSWEIPEGGCGEGEDPLGAAQSAMPSANSQSWGFACPKRLFRSVDVRPAVG